MSIYFPTTTLAHTQQGSDSFEAFKKEEQLNSQRTKRMFEYFQDCREGDSFEKKTKASLNESYRLQLPSGKVIAKEVFLECSVFENVKDKDDLFSELKHLTKSPAFQKEYESFLSNLTSENWFEEIRQDPKKMAQFSFLAYLEGNRIDREELFVINTVAEGYQELKNKKRRGMVGEVLAVRPVTLSSQDLANYLKEAGFPPFTENAYQYLITFRKPPEEIEKIKSQVVEEFGKRSPIQRTVLEYTQSRFLLFDKFEDSIEMRIYRQTKSRLGFLHVKQGENGAMVLLPPEFAIELFRKVSSNPSRSSSEHCLSFGYTDDNTVFIEGKRVITIPSPACEVLPHVHNLKNGPQGLGILFHDINYHIPVEVNNPHTSFYVEITKRLRSQLSPPHALLDQKPGLSRFSKAIVDRLVDRELNYRLVEPEKKFWQSLNKESLKVWTKEEFGSLNDYFEWYDRIYFPIIINVLKGSEDQTTAEKIQAAVVKVTEENLLSASKLS